MEDIEKAPDNLEKQLRDFKEELKKEIRAEIKEELAQLALNSQPAPQNIINNNINIININNYDTPDLSRIAKPTKEDLANVDRLSRFLLKLIYFNSDVPENHSLYLINSKEKTMAVREEGWQVKSANELPQITNNIRWAVYRANNELICTSDGAGANVKSGKREDRVDELIHKMVTHKDTLTDNGRSASPILSFFAISGRHIRQLNFNNSYSIGRWS